MAWLGLGPLWHGLTAPPFTWVKSGRFAVGRFPRRPSALALGRPDGARLVVNLHAKPHAWPPPAGTQVLHLPVVDGGVPTADQVAAFLEAEAAMAAQGGATLLHCAAGLGRSGTFASCWLMAHEGLGAEAALAHLRALRPGSVETVAQEAFLRAWKPWGKGDAAP